MRYEPYNGSNSRAWSHAECNKRLCPLGHTIHRKGIACRSPHICLKLLLPVEASHASASEASTSSQHPANIPSLLETYILSLPPRSKRRRLLLASTTLRSTLAKWKHEIRDHSELQSVHSPTWKAVTASVLPAGGWSDLGHNYIFQAGFWGWFIAQSLKIFTKRYKQGVWDVRAIVESGGMPSSHSALTAAVTTAVALEFGLGSSLFAVALCFTVITMYDAAGVRRHAGKQAEVLNILLDDVLQGHPVSDRKLKEVLGHTPVQVLSGAILGVIVACFVPSPSQLPIV